MPLCFVGQPNDVLWSLQLLRQLRLPRSVNSVKKTMSVLLPCVELAIDLFCHVELEYKYIVAVKQL